MEESYHSVLLCSQFLLSWRNFYRQTFVHIEYCFLPTTAQRILCIFRSDRFLLVVFILYRHIGDFWKGPGRRVLTTEMIANFYGFSCLLLLLTGMIISLLRSQGQKKKRKCCGARLPVARVWHDLFFLSSKPASWERDWIEQPVCACVSLCRRSIRSCPVAAQHRTL